MANDERRAGNARGGFTLLELAICAALILVISLLGFIASASSMRSADISRSMTLLQEELRSTMRALSDEVQPAVKRPRPGDLLPSKAAQALAIVDDSNPIAITYVVPTDMTLTNFSGVNTIQFVSEDQPAPDVEGGEFGNGQLDAGEDKNGDGLLNRQLVLTRADGTTKVLGGAAHLASVAFSLSPDGAMLQVAMVAATPLETGKPRMLQYRLGSNICMMN